MLIRIEFVDTKLASGLDYTWEGDLPSVPTKEHSIYLPDCEGREIPLRYKGHTAEWAVVHSVSWFPGNTTDGLLVVVYADLCWI